MDIIVLSHAQVEESLLTKKGVFEFNASLAQYIGRVRCSSILDAELDDFISVLTSRERIWNAAVRRIRELRELPKDPNWAEKKLWNATERYRGIQTALPAPSDRMLRLLCVQAAETKLRLRALLPNANPRTQASINSIEEGWKQLLNISIYPHGTELVHGFPRSTQDSHNRSQSPNIPEPDSDKSTAAWAKNDSRNQKPFAEASTPASNSPPENPHGGVSSRVETAEAVIVKSSSTDSLAAEVEAIGRNKLKRSLSNARDGQGPPKRTKLLPVAERDAYKDSETDHRVVNWSQKLGTWA